MIRYSKPSAGRRAARLALAVGVLLAGLAGPASAQVNVTVTRPAAPGSGAPLSLENAVPLAVPPPPPVRAPRPIAAPPRFVAPTPIEAPPPPEVAALPPVPPPALPAGAPPLPPPREAPSAPEPAPDVAVAPVEPARPQPPAQDTQTAALPPPPAAVPAMEDFSVVYAGAVTALPEDAEALVETAAARLRADERLRLQLRSYAEAGAETERDARRMSLERALALRERLAAHGVRSTRVDIRALGATAPDGPPDRIDVEFLND
ncbi:OmpA family protein [Azospirillum halopraeferens]|uniref:OmpA family protein n=1 Tax=Azospirillum halopraeferens TaxID=34010 RepID=UPI0006861050|nr:OmpA family protein [Azospirillum halopraeferens]